MYKAITTPHGLSFSCHIGWLPSKSKRHENDFKRLLGSWNSTHANLMLKYGFILMETKQVTMKQTNNTSNSLQNGPTHTIDI
jgi:hypothetical protein